MTILGCAVEQREKLMVETSFYSVISRVSTSTGKTEKMRVFPVTEKSEHCKILQESQGKVSKFSVDQSEVREN